MKSFVDLDRTLSGQPARLGVLLHRVDVSRGREELFLDQLPELLTTLANDARVASIRASTAIEGVDVETERAEKLAGGARFRNRNEREFAGYRDAIDDLVRRTPEPVGVPLVLHLHRQLFRHVDGHGGYLKREDNLIATYESGRREVVFKPPSAKETPFLTKELMDRYLDAQARGLAHPLVLLGALILDLLAIHPVADGNGRVARLLTTSELLNRGYRVARYVSVEQQIFETKNAYYAALAESQRDWHAAEHTIWPWVEYLVGTLAETYALFEQRVAAARQQSGDSKQQRVRRYALHQAPDTFRLADVRRALPGSNDQTIRLALNDLKSEGRVRAEGRGRGAVWRRI